MSGDSYPGRDSAALECESRASASEALKLGKLAQLMSAHSPGQAQSDITDATAALWLTESVNWQIARLNASQVGRDLVPLTEVQRIDLASIAPKLIELCDHAGMEIEVHRWVLELMVMTAPYFGLPREFAAAIRRSLWIGKLKSDDQSILVEERRTVKDAIIRVQNGFVQIPELTSQEFEDAVTDFIDRRQQQSTGDSWWSWTGRSPKKKPVEKSRAADAAKKGAVPKKRGAAEVAKKASARRTHSAKRTRGVPRA